jgi:rSAM/selenodomain-associated transferase 1
MKSSAIVVMAKEPIPGQVKTRLCPPLSWEQAAQLYEACCQDVIENALRIHSSQTVIAATPTDSVDYFQTLAPSAQVLPVEAETIGGCLQQVTSRLLNQGYPQVLAVSSDSPDLWPEIMQSGLDQLEKNDVVLGPAYDGGYYLIGLNKPNELLFGGSIEWSTEIVLQQTIQVIDQLGLTYALLSRSVTDLDRGEDLPLLVESLSGAPPSRARHTRQVLKTLDSHTGRLT